MVIASLVAGMGYPWWTVGIQFFVWLGRVLFSIGYASGGPSARIPGALIMDLAILGILGFAIATVIMINKEVVKDAAELADKVV